MRFILEIACDNAAFKSVDGADDASATDWEVTRLLLDTTTQISRGQMHGNLVDTNGNTVGEWKYTEAGDA